MHIATIQGRTEQSCLTWSGITIGKLPPHHYHYHHPVCLMNIELFHSGPPELHYLLSIPPGRADTDQGSTNRIIEDVLAFLIQYSLELPAVPDIMLFLLLGLLVNFSILCFTSFIWSMFNDHNVSK